MQQAPKERYLIPYKGFAIDVKNNAHNTGGQEWRGFVTGDNYLFVLDGIFQSKNQAIKAGKSHVKDKIYTRERIKLATIGITFKTTKKCTTEQPVLTVGGFLKKGMRGKLIQELYMLGFGDDFCIEVACVLCRMADHTNTEQWEQTQISDRLGLIVNAIQSALKQ